MTSNSKIRNSLLYLSEVISQIDFDEDDINVVRIKRFIHILSNIDALELKEDVYIN